MSTVALTPKELLVELSPTEKSASLQGDVRIPLTAIADVAVVPDALAAARGLRAPGLALPGVRKVGTWRTRAGATFVVARHDEAGVRLTLTGHDLAAVLIGDEDAEGLATRIRAAASAAASGAGRELDVRFPGPDRDLAGTLALPAGPGRYPAAVLVSGSGPVDRNSDAPRMPLSIARQLADALAGVGVASLRYDKRGVGDSRLRRDGTVERRDGWKRVGLFDNAEDVAAAVTALAARPEVDPERIFLIGHSEGAALVTLAAARLLADPAGPQPAGVVLLSAAATPGDAVLRWQVATLAPTLPAPVRGLLRLTRTDLVAKVSKNHDKLRRTTTDVARMGLVTINAKWFREYLDYDPRADLARLDVPVLALTGSKDLQVDPADLAAIADLVPGAVQTWCAPDVSHLLRTQPGAASLRAYKKEVRRPVDRAVLDRVTGWLTDQLGDAPGRPHRPAAGAPIRPAPAAAENPAGARPYQATVRHRPPA